MAQQTKPDSDVEQLKTVIANLANDVLDAHYDAHPHSNAFGAEYDGPGQTPSGTYYLGREHGANGADSDLGIDYCYRRFPDPDADRRGQDDTEYVYGKYGWMDASTLVDEADLLRAVFENAVEGDYLDETDLERYDDAVDAARGNLRTTREQYDLQDLATLFRSHEIDTLRTLLAHGDEEGRVVWQLCFSKDEDGNHIENTIDIPVLSEDGQFMLVTTERYYWDDQRREGKHYDYAAVVGYDDTPQRFFVHRLDGRQIGGDEPWTAARVKDAMGFDYNLDEVDVDDMPYGERIRVQGDLAVVRHDYDVALADHRETVLDSTQTSLLREHAEAFLDANPVYADHTDLYVSRHGRLSVRADDTDAIQALQDELGIDEETVRDEQDDRGYARLTAKRRAEIVEDLVREHIIRWASDQHDDVSLAAIKREAREDAREVFEDTSDQVNSVLGNHTIILSNVVEHPNIGFGDDAAQGAFVVPESASGFVIHGEHEDKLLDLGAGVYEFRFLDGHEDEWWQNSS